MRQILLTLAMFLFLGSNAYAISTTTVNFDPEGGGSYTEFDFFQLNYYNDHYTFEKDATLLDGESSTDDPSIGDTVYGHLFTEQDVATGDFTESFTVRMPEGQATGQGSGPTTVSFNDLYMDIQLEGNADLDENNVEFTSGSAEMYKEVDTDKVNIADLSLNRALNTDLGGSLVGSTNLDMSVDLQFLFDDVTSPDYWGPAENALVGKEFLFALTGGQVSQQNVWQTDDYYVIDWEYDGSRVEFSEIPEPTTLLLFGTGLLGLAAFGRKKFMNKS